VKRCYYEQLSLNTSTLKTFSKLNSYFSSSPLSLLISGEDNRQHWCERERERTKCFILEI
ncbi:hypothetical protein L9F63_005347, partial [Diploptera punctata]